MDDNSEIQIWLRNNNTLYRLAIKQSVLAVFLLV